MVKHSTAEVLMVRPVGFRYNAQTAVNNTYQSNDGLNPDVIQAKALEEFDQLVEKLEAKGVKVNVLQDTKEPSTPDSIFPNNWFSTHEEGLMVIYPMFAENRQAEITKFRKAAEDIADQAQKDVELFTILDYSHNRKRQQILEGTGSIVIDRKNKVAYCSLSERADKLLFEKWAEATGHEAVSFTSYQDGEVIYHTNILMGIGSKNALICLEAIDEADRDRVRKKLEAGGNTIIELAPEQLKSGLGNTLELLDANGKNFIAMSQNAYEALTSEQKAQIEAETEIVYSDISNIEYYGGGSVRCMIAEIF